MKILVLNAGSSSVKFTLFTMEDESVLAKGIVERIGMDGANLQLKKGAEKTTFELPVKDHLDAVKLVCAKLVDPRVGVLESLEEVSAVGHRVVHGGDKFKASTLITRAVKRSIEACFSLAPLHNPPNLTAIKACEAAMPGLPNVAVFDTAFHQTMPETSYLYAIPYELYLKEGIRKYGFHGTSHRFVTQAASDYLGKSVAETKLITCHLGNGSSIAAVNGGNVVDTTMGLTPLAGVIMGTRCGNIDAGAVIHMIKSGRTVDEVDNILNKQSGLLGVGVSSDMRDTISAMEEGNPAAKRAFDMFVMRIVEYIGAYYTVLGGADAVIFTGGIGENSIQSRRDIVGSLSTLGCHFAPETNDFMGETRTISTPKSTMQAIVIPTNEELMIARDTKELVEKKA